MEDDQVAAPEQGLPRLEPDVFHKTTISPYSLRGREQPTVATPVTWDEVSDGADAPDVLQQFLFEDVLRRVQEHGDLVADLP